MLEFVEGSLPANLNAAVAQHIRECPSCLAELELQSSRTRALQKLSRVQAPDQWSEISSSIRRVGWQYFVTRYVLPAVVFGCAAAVAFALISRIAARSSSAVPQSPSTTVPPAVLHTGNPGEDGSATQGKESASVQPERTCLAVTESLSGPSVRTARHIALESARIRNRAGRFGWRSKLASAGL